MSITGYAPLSNKASLSTIEYENQMRCTRKKNKENIINERIDKRKRWFIYRIEVYKEIFRIDCNYSISSMVPILLQ